MYSHPLFKAVKEDTTLGVSMQSNLIVLFKNYYALPLPFKIRNRNHVSPYHS